jgi:pimeloyl-ACP methyl ester carboxylesterase
LGPVPLWLKTANWLSHLELDWELPIYRYMLVELAKRNTLVRYDARGSGLSDWDESEMSLDAWVSDLKAVVDASGLERFHSSAIRKAAQSVWLSQPATQTVYQS